MLAPIDLNLVRLFVAVRETGSFTAAADRFGMPRSTVSRAIATLEARLGLVLFQRTTRTVAITHDGQALFEGVGPSLAQLDGALADIPERTAELAGTLRLTALPDLASVVLAEAVAQFAARYPRIAIDLQLTPALVDLAREDIDLALRVQVRPARATSLVARKVGDIAVQLFAAPAYLARRGTPRASAELAAYDWITFRGAVPLQPTRAWFRDLPARRRIACDDMRFARDLVRLGAGIGALPSFLAQQDLLAGTLVRVLPKLTLGRAPVYLVRPARTHVPRRTTLFRDLVVELLQQRPLDAEP